MLHITEAELARDVHGVREKVRQGAEVIIEENCSAVATLWPAARRRRKLSEIAALLPARSTAALDAGFAADVQEFIDNHREPMNPPNWD